MSRQSPVPVQLPPYGVYAWESRHVHGFRMKAEKHDFAELFFILDGNGRVNIGPRSHDCHAGDVLFVHSNMLHQFEDRDKPLTLYGIAVANRIFESDPHLLPLLPDGPLPSPKTLQTRVKSMLRQLLYEQETKRPGYGTKIVALTLELCVRVARTGKEKNRNDPGNAEEVIERFMVNLKDRFFEPLSVDKVARELNLSRRTFTRLFRDAVGVSFAKYLEQLRIAYAKKRLKGTAQAILPVAFECGYEDLSSFYRAFRRQTGEPPDHWRKNQIGTV